MHTKTRRLVMAALCTAITAVFAQIIIPLPFTLVPFSMSIVAVFLTGALLDAKYAFASQVVYVLLGAAGLPVFGGFTGGIGIIAGPTGGYILAYPLMALAVAFLSSKWGKSFWKFFVTMTVGLGICYAVGVLQLMIYTGNGIVSSLMGGVVPFIFTDMLKVALSSMMAGALNRALSYAKLTFSIM